MKLKAFINSLDEVDEKYRDLYVEDGDGFKLDVDGINGHPDVAALSNALNRTKGQLRERTTERDTLQTQVELLPEDFDRDLYDRAKAQGVGGGKVQNEDEIRAEAANAAKTRAEAAAKVVLDKVTVDRDRFKARVERSVRDQALDAALDEVKVTDPAYRRGARALLASSIKVVEHDGEFEALAVEPDLGDIPVTEHVKAWAKTDEGKAYVGARDSAGGGANGGTGNGNPTTSSDGNPWKASSVNITEQARIRREDPVLAARLMREAGLTAK